jgi:hypothetical protein
LRFLNLDGSLLETHCHPQTFTSLRPILERETGIEPATNSLEGCDSTTELLPPVSQLSITAVSKPQRLKPRLIPTPEGTAEAVPFHKSFPPAEILRKERSGFRLRAPASLTPANRLKSGADDQD